MPIPSPSRIFRQTLPLALLLASPALSGCEEFLEGLEDGADTGDSDGGSGSGSSYDCPSDSSLPFGSYACPWYMTASEAPNSFVLAFGDDDYNVYEISVDITIDVDNEGEQSLTKVLESSREIDGTRVFGVTMPGASYNDTDIEVRATIELDNFYVVDTVCEYSGPVWGELDGQRIEGDDRGSGDDCYLRFDY